MSSLSGFFYVVVRKPKYYNKGRTIHRTTGSVNRERERNETDTESKQ